MRESILGVDGVSAMHDLTVPTSRVLHQMEVHLLTVNEGHRIAKAVEHTSRKGVSDIGRVIVRVEPILDEKQNEQRKLLLPAMWRRHSGTVLFPVDKNGHSCRFI